ncbi:histidinol-phosphatase HisJ family protein [Helicovermis profundi]|uniref:Histidinol-phosphatase n=1 Tax=Helicovermis profundi TaxID=3065157 RepID=A0AAU9EQC8_9FIRM|nr:histidinol-phosphatase HisJ family protein [Clostridia bacterium S502]
MDYHIHTSYSADCKEDMEEIIIYAIKNNIEEICFTDHIDYDYTDKTIEFNFDINNYIEHIIEIREKYKNEIAIKIGIELGIQPHILDLCRKVARVKDIDFIIASMHVCSREDLYLGEYFINRSPREALKNYILEMTEMLKEFRDYSVIGHIDLLKRYSTEIAKLSPKEFECEYTELFKVIIENGKGIELNTSGLRQDVNEQFPSEYLLKLYKSLGGTIITLGSDSHTKDTLEANFVEVKKILKKCGFNELYKFSKLRPKKYSI